MQQAQSENRVTPYNKSKIGGRNSECIKVCVRVRPILPREVGKEEVVYYPTDNTSDLEVSFANHLLYFSNHKYCLGHKNRRRVAYSREQVRQSVQSTHRAKSNL